MNSMLKNIIDEVQSMSEKSVAELEYARRRYGLTPAQFEMKRRELFGPIEEKVKQSVQSARELIKKKIAKIDDEEYKMQEQRAKDTFYQSRLQTKINNACSIDLQKVDVNSLKAMFSEFKDDPIAIELICAKVNDIRLGAFIPDNNLGKRQKHLQAVAQRVIWALQKAGEFNSREDKNGYRRKGADPNSRIDAVKEYIVAQNEDFSLDDATVLADLVKKGKISDVDAWILQTSLSVSK